MNQLATILETLQDRVPDSAKSVVMDLHVLVMHASEKEQKYKARGFVSKIMHLRTEKQH